MDTIKGLNFCFTLLVVEVTQLGGKQKEQIQKINRQELSSGKSSSGAIQM
jgi:hypothetical protein